MPMSNKHLLHEMQVESLLSPFIHRWGRFGSLMIGLDIPTRSAVSLLMECSASSNRRIPPARRRGMVNPLILHEWSDVVVNNTDGHFTLGKSNGAVLHGSNGKLERIDTKFLHPEGRLVVGWKGAAHY